MAKKDIEKVVEALHPLERKVLAVLKDSKTVDDVIIKSKLSYVEVMRALQWMENKNILKLNEKVKEVILLGENGRNVFNKGGAPEIRFLSVLDKVKSKSLDSIKKEANLSPEEFGASMGILKKNSCILIDKDGIKKTPAADIYNENFNKQKKFLEKIDNKNPLEVSKLDEKSEEKSIYQELLKRKDYIIKEERKTVLIEIYDLGKELLKQDLSGETIDSLTPDMIKSKEWKDKKFRRYDVSINVPKIYGGKKHFVNQAVDYIKKIWLEMGFSEMNGNYVQTSFWDLDSLFVPQDHPARQMQDTFYIKDPKLGILPDKIYKKVKNVHENGSDTGSKGWGGKWSEEIAKENLLRTHTTVLSAQTISKLKKEDLPAKFFSVGKVFRNETLDWKHLFEFYQVEGIVVDPNANLKHLKGYLKEFYKKMGYEKVRMRPAHFPYTEPSLEVDVFHPVKKEWVELGGAGIFRPEVTKTLLGFECPVLAWGQGMGRIISEYWNITDIRDLYKNDLKQIREMKQWMR